MNYVALMALIIVEIETLSDFLRKHNSIEIQCQATRLSPTIPEIIVKKWINLKQLSGSYQKNIKHADEKIVLSHMPVMIYDIRKRYNARPKIINFDHIFHLDEVTQRRSLLFKNKSQEETWRWLINSNLTLISD